MFEEKSKNIKKTAVKAAIAAAGIGVAATLAYVATYNAFFPRYERPDYEISPGLEFYPRVEANYTRKRFYISANSERLAAYYYPTENSLGLVVFTHGYRSGADDHLSLICALVDCGYSVLSYDGTGAYDSSGASCVGMCRTLLDLDCVLNYVAESEFSGMPLYLLGYSLGAYASAAVLARHREVRACALIAPMNNAATVMVEMAERYVGALAKTARPVFNIYQRILFGDYVEYDGVSGINSTDIPILVAQGMNDDVITHDGLSIYAKRDSITNPNVEYYLVDGIRGDHHSILFSEKACAYRSVVDADLDSIKCGGADVRDRLIKKCAEVNHELYSEVNSELVDKILKTFAKSK